MRHSRSPGIVGIADRQVDPRDGRLSATALTLRSAAWYGDHRLTLPLPSDWIVDLRSPPPAAALTDREIDERLDAPVGQPTIRELARGKQRPVIIVDDLNRSTPASRITPALLRQFADAGISADRITLVMGPGTHGAPPSDAMAKKVGAEVARACRVAVHDSRGEVVRIGRTSHGTPVLVNRHVAESDFVVGIGEIVPNQTAGFGGGSKLSLGVLGFRSIAGLHFGHEAVGWGHSPDGSSFRHDLDEISQMIGLRWSVSVLINADREVIDLRCGDPTGYYHEFLNEAMNRYRTKPPDGSVDVVISNTYPNDQSLTFARMKGFAPLNSVREHTSRIAVAACPEGLGFHGLFPFLNAPPNHGNAMRVLRARIILRHPALAARKVRRRIARRGSDSIRRRDVWLFAPATASELPSAAPGMRIRRSWSEVVDGVVAEQGGRRGLRVIVYPCASIQSMV